MACTSILRIRYNAAVYNYWISNDTSTVQLSLIARSPTNKFNFHYMQALVWRKDIEGEKSREYRLSAFTGDLPG